MNNTKQTITYILSILLVLFLGAPDYLTVIHQTHNEHHHEDGATCQICVLLDKLVEARNQMTVTPWVVGLMIPVFLPVFTMGQKAQAYSLKTLVSLNVKMTN